MTATDIPAQRALGIGRSILAAAVAFIAVSIVIYWLFYSSHPYNEETGAGLEAFKDRFWMAFFVHLILAFAVALGAAWLMGARNVPAAIATVAIVIGLLAVPTLSMLSQVNDCNGVDDFPLSASCITQTGNE
jgi:hypothetical protein